MSIEHGPPIELRIVVTSHGYQISQWRPANAMNPPPWRTVTPVKWEELSDAEREEIRTTSRNARFAFNEPPK